MLKVAEQFPDFCLPNQDEAEVCSRDLRGNWIVLYCYPKDNTPGCTTEACGFTASLRRFDKLTTFVLVVSPDSAQKLNSFIDKT